MSFTLNAVKRVIKGEKTREGGALPAVVYGAGGEVISLDLNYTEFAKLFKEAGESSLIDLKIDNQDAGKMLVQEIQFEPISGCMSHVDLRRIDMNKSIEAKVELRFIGESPAVKAMGGTLVHNVNEVEVKCLPSQLVGHIDVDLSGLKTFDDVIKVKDLVLPTGIIIISPNAEDLIAKAAAAMSEEEIKALEDSAKTADISKIEVVGKKPEEGEDAAKGEEKKEEKK